MMDGAHAFSSIVGVGACSTSRSFSVIAAEGRQRHPIAVYNKSTSRAEVCMGWSEAALELEEHVNCVAGFHVVVGDVVLVCERLACVDQTNHENVDAFLLLQRLFDLQNCVRGLEVERLLHSGECLSGRRAHTFQ